jgi:hypothetical protein
LALTLLLSALLASCTGGRGSSGFDLREDLLIQRVLETGECAQADGLRICPSDAEGQTITPTPTAMRASEATVTATPTPRVPPPSPPRTATPTVVSEPSILTSLGQVTSIHCIRDVIDGPCRVDVDIRALGFPAETDFRVAMRASEFGSTWILQAAPIPRGGGDPPEYRARVEVLPPFQREAQIAVLAYLSGASGLPAQFVSLVDSRADLAFVVQPVHLVRVFAIPSPTATPTPIPPGDAPRVSYLGLADGARVPVAPTGADHDDRPVLAHPGAGAVLVIEGRIGNDGHPLGVETYRDDGGLPDLQVILSNPLGDGSPTVCDLGAGVHGGVPAVEPFAFDISPAVADAVNDLGCRFNDGSGRNRGQIETEFACTRASVSSPFAFVDPASNVQYCLPLARAWDFPVGDTIVAARIRDVAGAVGRPKEVVIRRLP